MKKIAIAFLVLIFTCVNIFSQNAAPNDERNIDREFYNAEKLFFQKKYNFAREAFLLYIKRRPLSTNDMLYYYIGACYFQDKQYENAINYYKLAFDINDSYSFCNNIANSYYQLKNYDEALIWYNRAIERLYSPYNAKLNYEVLTNYTVSQNVVTNTIFIFDNNNTDNITNLSLSNDIISNTALLVTNNIITNTTLSNNIASNNISTNNADNFTNTTENISNAINNLNQSNENIKNLINNTFTKLPLFTNIVVTNTFTNEYEYTNTTVIFEVNTNFMLEVVDPTVSETSLPPNLDNTNENATNSNSHILATNSTAAGSSYVITEENPYIVTNIMVMTNITDTNGNSVSIKTNVASVDLYNTWGLYYSAYLNMGHTYLTLGDITNAAISYEIFLTNVGSDYYQKESLERVISLIRSNDTSIKFMPFTNNYRVTTNNDGSITTENMFPNFDYERETIYPNGVRIVYENGKIEKTKIYSNNYEVSYTIYPYGKREIEIVSKNGDKRVETYMIDNSKSINTKTSSGNIYEYTLYSDGSFINRKTLENNKAFVVERSDGSITTNYKDDNGAFFYSRSLDGTEVKRTEDNLGNITTETRRVDGALIVKTENPDGSYTVVANYVDGSIGTTTVDTNGMSNLKIVYPDGRVEERNSQGAGVGTFSYNVKADDGSIITKTYNEDGSFTVVTKKVDGTIITDTVGTDTISEIKMPNGTTIKRIIRQDGSKETTTLNKDSSSVTEVASADSSSVTTTIKPNGSSIVVVKDVYGNTETTNTEADGSTSTTKTTTDGKTTINEVRANGVTIDIENDGRNKTTIAKDAEGYVLEMKQYRNEAPTITLVDALGEAVDIDTARRIIRNMDLNIKAEDIDNLKVVQEEIENVATEDNTDADENIQNTQNSIEETTENTAAQNAESNIAENNNAENADNNIETTQNNTQQQ
ncbi:tetratricopeptide repeat protein [Brachyspira pilosicoli]|uniref:Tetratricopeptide repeat protein n=1 Tax=Brachyspira pilosicoli TaxID=52584 RepID=A0A5C8EUG4_BRAPL|nr:tetratricopeptide repeat protein [Brachyspira pilosicoli]TXJ41043.1 tetratricopeptide repeat protein [Brachyspira pilosicoli]